MKFVISSYKDKGDSLALYELKDVKINKLSGGSVVAPSFIVSDNEFVYTYGKDNGVNLYSFKIENDNLVLFDELKIEGVSATHLTYSKKHNLLIGCSYADGAIFSAGVVNGKFTKLYTYKKQITDDRLSRAHCCLLNNDETNLAVVNIALDAVYFYDIKDNRLIYKDIINLPKGVGPRHAIYNSDNTLMYIMTEYSNEVIIIDLQKKEIVQTISTIPNFKDETYGATLIFSKDEKYLYASNRGEDSIAKFKVLEDGKLQYENTFSCGGKHPRHMTLSGDGKYIISCNKNSGNVAIINLETEEVEHNIEFEEASGVDLIK